MEFKVNSKDLEKLLSRIIPAVPTRTTMPVLENFLFDINNGSLTVCATDIEIALRSSINVAADENISMIIPAKFLYDIIKSLDDTQLVIKTETGSKLKIKTDTGEYNIGYASPESFPEIPQVSKENETVLSGAELKKAIDQTSFAMSKEDMRPAMTGTLFEFTASGLKFVATDGHRLVKYVNNKIKSDTEEMFIVPERAISVLSKLLGDTDVKIYKSKTNFSFHIGDIEFITRLIGEKYPAYASVIPLENENLLKVKRSPLMSTVKRMLLFSTSGTKQVKFSISKDSVEVSAEDVDHGSDGKDVVACEYSGDPMDIGFNTNYINDILSHVNDEEVIFKLHSPTKACIIEPVKKTEDEEIMLLLMPVRLNN